MKAVGFFYDWSGRRTLDPYFRSIANAFADLGMEAIHEFVVQDMPVTVAVDTQGNSVHRTGPARWKRPVPAPVPV